VEGAKAVDGTDGRGASRTSVNPSDRLQSALLTEGPSAQFMAPDLVDFLNLVADAPVYDEDPDRDPLAY
jgi:hypothetical protein